MRPSSCGNRRAALGATGRRRRRRDKASTRRSMPSPRQSRRCPALRLSGPGGSRSSKPVPTRRRQSRELWSRKIRARGPSLSGRTPCARPSRVRRDLDIMMPLDGHVSALPTLADTPDLVQSLEPSATAAGALIRRLTVLARDAETMVGAMDFGFLFDPMRQLFSLGYRVTDGSLDPGRYDLLASEARLTSFVAIANGDVPVSHWFRLGRALTPVGPDSALVSWSGSMFEYLMPALVLRAPAGSLLDQTCRLVVRRQIAYGAERGVPGGGAEAGHNPRDLAMAYPDSAFGGPGLGLQRGLSDDVVIAPYATALAAMIDPAAAVRNFQRLAEAGACGAYGFYEALDYTASRLPEGTGVAIVRSYMAHHQGMVLVALATTLREGVMRARFQ